MGTVHHHHNNHRDFEGTTGDFLIHSSNEFEMFRIFATRSKIPHDGEHESYRISIIVELHIYGLSGRFRQGHCHVLVPAREPTRVRVVATARHTLLKFLVGQILGQLRKDGTTCVHAPLFRAMPYGPAQQGKSGFQIVPDKTMLSLMMIRRLYNFFKK
jgi:hypothetical protein